MTNFVSLFENISWLHLLEGILYYFIFSHPTPWCQSDWSEVAIGNATLCTFEGSDTTDRCFDSSSNVTVQKIRQCDQDETPFLVLLVGVVVVLNLASLLATLRLNKIIN